MRFFRSLLYVLGLFCIYIRTFVNKKVSWVLVVHTLSLAKTKTKTRRGPRRAALGLLAKTKTRWGSSSIFFTDYLCQKKKRWVEFWWSTPYLCQNKKTKKGEAAVRMWATLIWRAWGSLWRARRQKKNLKKKSDTYIKSFMTRHVFGIVFRCIVLIFIHTNLYPYEFLVNFQVVSCSIA